MDGAVCTEVFEGVGVEESACFGVIVAGLQVVQAGFHIVVVTAVADEGDLAASILYHTPARVSSFLRSAIQKSHFATHGWGLN